MGKSFHTTRRVEWHATDAAGIAHFSAFFRYMEEVEHEFLRSVGIKVIDADAEGPISWPRVSVRCDFQGAVRFDDVLDVELNVARIGGSSVQYEFVFTHDGRPVAEGAITAVCCRLTDGQPPRSIIIPAHISAKLKDGSAA